MAKHPKAKTINLRPQPRVRRGGSPAGPRPEQWVSGPDPVRHAQHIAWHRARAQANFRKEAWELDFEAWVEIWGDSWAQRGRSSGSLCLTRDDNEGAWTRNNVSLVVRGEHCRRNQKFTQESL